MRVQQVRVEMEEMQVLQASVETAVLHLVNTASLTEETQTQMEETEEMGDQLTVEAADMYAPNRLYM
jgi:hypothetical protein